MDDFIYQNKRFYSSIEFAMFHIGGTWKMPILASLRNGPVRYGNLKKCIAHITDKMLIMQLRELEEKQMVTRITYREKPPRVEYALTERAQKAFRAIDALSDYGELLKEMEAGQIRPVDFQ